MSRFDWYQATVEAPPGLVKEALAGVRKGALWVDDRPRHSYEAGAALMVDDERVATVWWGGRNGHPHVIATSDDAHAAAEALREAFPRHRVTRADVCDDYQGEGTFDTFRDRMLPLADRMGVKPSPAGDWFREGAPDGRTLYLGSPSSAVRVRAYEKGKEVLGKHPAMFHGFLAEQGYTADLTRLEIQVRPQTREARENAATMPPAAFWGCSKWSKELVKELLAIEVERVQIAKGYQPTATDRAYGFAIEQYGRTFEAMVEQLGSWECLGLQMRDDIAKLREGKKG